MDKFSQLYKQYALYKENIKTDYSDLETDLLQYNITEEYFVKVSKSIELLLKFYHGKLDNSTFHGMLDRRINHKNAYNVKFCLLIDILRCYDGLNHATTFITPEGIALMVLLDRLIGQNKIMAYGNLGEVGAATLSLIDLVPYLNECSEQLGSIYSLFLPTILERKSEETERLYRQLLYSLCRTIAEVDNELSPVEEI